MTGRAFIVLDSKTGREMLDVDSSTQLPVWNGVSSIAIVEKCLFQQSIKITQLPGVGK